MIPLHYVSLYSRHGSVLRCFHIIKTFDPCIRATFHSYCYYNLTVESCKNTGAKVFVPLRANCCTNCYYNFNPCGIFEKMTLSTPIFNQVLEQGKLMAVLNSRK